MKTIFAKVCDEAKEQLKDYMYQSGLKQEKAIELAIYEFLKQEQIRERYTPKRKEW